MEYFKSRLYKNEMTTDSLIMSISAVMVGAFNYFYQVYMGRTLGPEDYGVFGSLFAIFYMIMVVSQTLGTTTTNFVSKFRAEGKEIGFFLNWSLKEMALIGLVVSVVFIALSENLSALFKLPDNGPMLVLAPILFLTLINSIGSGALRGVKRFYALSFVSASNAIFKLFFGVLLVTLGYGVSGALWGVALGMLFGFVFSLIYLKPYFKPNTPHEPEFHHSSLYRYSIPVLFSMVCFSVPSNFDVVLSKLIFSPADAGLYTCASVFGKIIFFSTAGIYTVMFPIVAEKHSKGEETITNLKKGLLYTALLSGAVAIIYLIFPQIVILVFGSKYAGALSLVAPYGFAMFFFSLTTVVLHYHLAIRNIMYVALFAVMTFAEIAMLLIFSSTVLEMAQVLFATNFIILIISLIYTKRWKYDIPDSTNI